MFKKLRQLKIKPGVIYTFLSALVIIGGTIAAIQYAKGNYRFTNSGFVKETGLLSANSSPTGAQVFIDGKLVTATDDTLYLEPGVYEVELKKDGYTPWKKTMTLEKELVAQTNALLFPSAPSLSPLTFTGVENVSPSPDGNKLIYYTASASSQTQNGLYLLEMSSNVLPFQKDARQIAQDSSVFDLATADFIWSPDSNEVMVISNDRMALLDLSRNQNIDDLPDVTFRQRQILSNWEEEMYLRERQFLAEFPEEIIAYATESARNVYLSPDKKRLMYTALTAFTLDESIMPPVPATNTQPEKRELVPYEIYVYDREEDKNFLIGTEPTQEENIEFPQKRLLATDLYQREPLTLEASPSAFARLQATESARTASNFRTYHTSLYSNTYQWFPDSRHIIHTPEENQVQIMEYDGTNNTTVFAATFDRNFVYPWPNGSSLLVLTSFSPNVPANLYAIDLK